MPTTTTFTTTDGTPDGRRYFQDIEVSPVTVASGALVRRFDTLRYPGNGRKLVFAPTVVAVDPDEGTVDTEVEVTITGAYFDAGVTVTVSGSGVTVTGIRRASDGDSVRATFAIADDAATTARNVTVTNTDSGTVTANGAFTVLAADG